MSAPPECQMPMPVDAPALQITRTGARWRSPDRDADPLRQAFDRCHCAKLAGFLDPVLRPAILGQIEHAQFEEYTHRGIGTDLTMTSNTCAGLLHFLVNDATVYELVETISGIHPIRYFGGRVYRRIAGRHSDSWHTDLIDGRLIGMSVNLSAEPFDGGLFEIRDAETEQVLGSIANTGWGDAILFRLAPPLEHRVTPVSGARPKAAFAGWFRAGPDYLAALRGRPDTMSHLS